MKRTLLYRVIFLLLFVSFQLNAQKPKPIKPKAKETFEYINKVRANPAAYSKSIGGDLSKVEKRKALLWNDTLAKVAEEKALDMARRNYFDHVDPNGRGINILIHNAGYKLPEEWISSMANNYFESLAAGLASGEQVINMLIVDEGEPTLGHRKHLLGIDDWNASLTDIGIGFVYAPDTEFKYYVSIIIAKREW